MTEASTVSKRTYAHSTVSKKRIKTLAACTSRVLAAPDASRTRNERHNARCQTCQQPARSLCPLACPAQTHTRLLCTETRSAIAAGSRSLNARSRSAAPSGNSVATGSCKNSRTLLTSGVVSAVSGVGSCFRLPVCKHPRCRNVRAGIDGRDGKSALADCSPPDLRGARSFAGLGRFSRPVMRAVATATAASRGVANEPRLTWDRLAASQTLACHGCFLRCSGYTSF
jgi:hypothetical protein